MVAIYPITEKIATDVRQKLAVKWGKLSARNDNNESKNSELTKA
tara:strand:+ start:43 stop:174 length:132 start_codon:yes stop_codon:yes gene_type:complete